MRGSLGDNQVATSHQSYKMVVENQMLVVENQMLVMENQMQVVENQGASEAKEELLGGGLVANDDTRLFTSTSPSFSNPE